MATQNTPLVRDNSTVANFKSWASTISAFFTTAGWVQSTDTGQVNWGTIAAVPAAGSYVYEIWKPGDALTVFYLKVEYGTGAPSSNTQPLLRCSIGSGTNGAGVLSGYVTQAIQIPGNVNVSSTVTQFQCYFSGDTGRMGVMMWRDDTTNAGPIFFGVQRSLNSSGSPTSAHVTLLTCGFWGTSQCSVGQQTLVFGIGVSNPVVQGSTGVAGFISLKNLAVTSDAFYVSVAMSPVFPGIGYFDDPLDIAAVLSENDVIEGASYVIAAANMPYGVSHTYIASKNSPFTTAAGYTAYGTANSSFMMRYD